MLNTINTQARAAIRELYEAAPGSTIDGLATRFGVSWMTAYAVLAGVGEGGRDLVLERVENATVIAKRTGMRVRPEPEARSRYIEATVEGARPQYHRRRPLKVPVEPYERLVGARLSEGKRRMYAAQRARRS